MVTLQVPDSSPHVLDKSALYYGGSRVFSAAGMAAAGCHARSRKKPLRTAGGSEES